jgi:uncharacterized phiE125 gp8 family phage protein
MFRPVLVTAPASDIVSLAEVKAHCRVDHTSEDTYLSALIQAATSHLDGYSGVLGRALLPQTWRQDFEDFGDVMRLPIGPVQSITSVIYQDTSGADQTLANTEYVLLRDNFGDYVTLAANKSWPSVGDRADAVRITYLAGTASIPVAIKHAALLLVGHWFSHREAVSAGSMMATPIAVDALLTPHRMLQP